MTFFLDQNFYNDIAPLGLFIRIDRNLNPNDWDYFSIKNISWVEAGCKAGLLSVCSMP
jgi:hypothetical protein